MYFDSTKWEFTDDSQFGGSKQDKDKKKRVKWTVLIDLDTAEPKERFWSCSLGTAEEIGEYLKQGFKLLKIKRLGLQTATKYTITPVSS